jgi:tellurite resistance protein TerA
MSRETLSSDAIFEATRTRAKFSGHGNAMGAAGFRAENDGGEGEFLSNVGDTGIINAPKDGFHHIRIGAAWDNIAVEQGNFFQRLFKKAKKEGIDIDLGCLYELNNGKRGAVQAFGQMFGAYKAEPYILLSGDEKTGDSIGHDEFIMINGDKWNEIKRILIYVYIYDGEIDWDEIKPQIQVIVPDQPPLIVRPQAHQDELDVCAIAGIENIRGNIKLTNYTEYFPGHAEMDRAFGYGLQWDDGEKIR